MEPRGEAGTLPQRQLQWRLGSKLPRPPPKPGRDNRFLLRGRSTAPAAPADLRAPNHLRGRKAQDRAVQDQAVQQQRSRLSSSLPRQTKTTSGTTSWARHRRHPAPHRRPPGPVEGDLRKGFAELVHQLGQEVQEPKQNPMQRAALAGELRQPRQGSRRHLLCREAIPLPRRGPRLAKLRGSAPRQAATPGRRPKRTLR